MMLQRFVFVLFVGVLGTAIFFLADWRICLPEGRTSEYVGRDVCARCHLKECELWKGSDHDRAMDLATSDTVLGDFDNREFTHFGLTSKMVQRDGKFFTTTDNREGKSQTFEVKYVFGVRPLQQYLVEFPDGRVQCLPIAWDTEKKRWFHLYPDEKIPSDDALHWTRPLQNWNYMCAECHSTDLKKNYNAEKNTYHTTFAEIDVSCETCHGPGSLHVELAESNSPFWDRRYGYGLPDLKNKDSRVEIETCGPCHARRHIVYPGQWAGKPFLDHYMPEMLNSESYYADGQIREEDYVYGSFIQSRMYREGVRCTDCHDPHSAKVKFDDNRLCGQCHVPAKYDTPIHHHHPDATKAGTKCVECHMPETTYMVVDPRRDHSIKVPRPDLTVALGIPNACNGCHDDKKKGETPEWAEKKLTEWYGKRKEPKHFAYAIDAGRKGEPQGERALMAVVRRKDTSAMVRASAILLLGGYQSRDACMVAADCLNDKDALVRVAAVRSLEALPDDELKKQLTPMLYDPIRAVRVEAARILSRLPANVFNEKDRKAFDRALKEYLTGQKSMEDQPAARLNLAVILSNQGLDDKAEEQYIKAIQLDPLFVPTRINLAMLYDQQGKKAKAEKQFRKIIELQPELAEAHYWLGLLLAEDKDRLSEAVKQLAEAARLSPGNARIHYNHGLALQRLKCPKEAEAALKRAYELAPRMSEYLYALAILYSQQKQWSKATACGEELIRRQPSNPQFRSFMQHIKRESGSG